jgi:L-2,4-diaminobutyric acid acetyltransferase
MSHTIPARTRRPTIADAPAVHQLIATCPPLDCNSRYAYLLICRDFADGCILAEDRDRRPIGVITGYRPPDRPDTLFIWQVAVHQAARGRGLARHMLELLLDRPCHNDVRWVEATVGPQNAASRALFAALATARGVNLSAEPLFEADLLGSGHEPEWLHRIGPMSGSPLPALQEV